jgi:hypothetical protein
MKRLKYKKLLLTGLLGIFCFSGVFASRTERWKSNSSRIMEKGAFPENKFVDSFAGKSLDDSDGNLRDGAFDPEGGGQKPPQIGEELPVGNASAWMAALALGYGMYLLRKRKEL